MRPVCTACQTHPSVICNHLSCSHLVSILPNLLVSCFPACLSVLGFTTMILLDHTCLLPGPAFPSSIVQRLMPFANSHCARDGVHTRPRKDKKDNQSCSHSHSDNVELSVLLIFGLWEKTSLPRENPQGDPCKLNTERPEEEGESATFLRNSYNHCPAVPPQILNQNVWPL